MQAHKIKCKHSSSGGRDIKREEQTEGTINKINKTGKRYEGEEGKRQENCEGKRLDH